MIGQYITLNKNLQNVQATARQMATDLSKKVQQISRVSSA